ncbi:tetratricopeptide repeat protein [Vibrio navarrensis]
MFKRKLLLWLAISTFSCMTLADNSGLHQWLGVYQQKLRADDSRALDLLQDRYSALLPGAEKLYVSGLLFDYLSARHQPYYGASQNKDTHFSRQESLYIQALYDRQKGLYEQAVKGFTTLLNQATLSEEQKVQELLLYQLCYTLNEQGDYHKAKFFCSQLKRFATEESESLLPKYLVYRVIANNEHFRGEFEQSLIHYQAMLRHLPANADVSDAYNDTGNLLRELGQYAQAEEYLLKAKEIRESGHSQAALAQILHSLAELYHDRGDQPQAILYYEQALAILIKENHTFGLVMTYLGLGSLYLQMNNAEKGSYYLELALKAAEKGQNHRLAAEVHSRFSLGYLEMGKLSEAMTHATQAYNLAVSMDMPVIEANALLLQSNIEVLQGNYQKAYQHYTLYSQLELSFRDKDTTKAIEALDLAQKQFDYQLRLTQLQSDTERKMRLVKSLEQEKFLYSLLLIALVTLLLVLALANHRYRKQRQTDRLTTALNRRAIIEAIEAQTTSRAPHKVPVLILFKLDSVKAVNREFGHAYVDELLHTIACNLIAHLLPGELLGRLNGTEFMVLLKEVDEIDVPLRVEQLSQRIANSVVYSQTGEPIQLNACMAYLVLERSAPNFDCAYNKLEFALSQRQRERKMGVVDASRLPVTLEPVSQAAMPSQAVGY